MTPFQILTDEGDNNEVRKQPRVLKWGLLPLLLLLIPALTSGCAGGVRATNWTSIVLEEDVLYAADLEQVRALDVETGEVMWAFPDQPDLASFGPFYTVSLEPGEALFVTSKEKMSEGFLAGYLAQPQGILRALSVDPNEAEGRRLLWQFTEAEGDYVEGGATADGLLVIGNGDGAVYGLETDRGTLAWSFPTDGRVWARPLVLSDTVYVASLDHSLYALDVETGQERWQFSAGGAIASHPLVLDGRLYFGSFDHKLYALQDGTPVWEFEGTNWFWGTPAGDGSNLYAVDVSGNVYAVDIESGELEWSVEVDNLVHLGPALSQHEEGDVLLIAGNEGTLYGLNASNGVELWSNEGDGQLADMIVRDGIVYVSRVGASERIQAFYAENGRTLWTYSPEESE